MVNKVTFFLGILFMGIVLNSFSMENTAPLTQSLSTQAKMKITLKNCSRFTASLFQITDTQAELFEDNFCEFLNLISHQEAHQQFLPFDTGSLVTVDQNNLYVAVCYNDQARQKPVFLAIIETPRLFVEESPYQVIFEVNEITQRMLDYGNFSHYAPEKMPKTGRYVTLTLSGSTEHYYSPIATRDLGLLQTTKPAPTKHCQ